MTLNSVKLWRVVTFTRSLFETLIWNKITFPASNLLNFGQPVENELMKNIAKTFYQYSFFYLFYPCLLQRF